MNVDFELYRIFYVVATNGNITKASQELLISQPAVTKSIKKLEDALGGQLFVRTKKGVNLTNEGKEIYYYIKNAIEYINNAENKFTNLKQLSTGNIKIGVSTTLAKNFLMPYLNKFHTLYPNIKIEINNSLTTDLIDYLRKGTIDIVFLNLPYEEKNDVIITPVKEIHDCFIVGNNYSNLKNKVLDMNDLNNYPLILQRKGSNTRTFLDNFMKEKNITLNSNMDIASYNLMTELVKIGFGIGFATREYINNELKNGDLIELKIKQKIPPRHIAIATIKNTIPSFSTKKLIEIIEKK